jgi:hypothetical protein
MILWKYRPKCSLANFSTEHNTFLPRKKVAQTSVHFLYLHNFQKLPIENRHPIDKNSANLVTLVSATNIYIFGSRLKHRNHTPRSRIVLWRYGWHKSFVFGGKKQKNYSTSAADALLVRTVSLENFYLKITFFYFEKCDSFLEKNHLKSVGVRSLTAALIFFSLQKRHYSTSGCMISMDFNRASNWNFFQIKAPFLFSFKWKASLVFINGP